MMKMTALVALGKFTYAKQNIAVGQTFDASPRDARILVALRKAQIDPAGHAAPPVAPVAPVVQAEEQPVKEVVIEAMQEGDYITRARKPRSYARRTTMTDEN